MNPIEDRLAQLLTTRFGLNPENVRPDTTFGELEVDSLSLVELTVVSEDVFGVAFGGDDFTKEHTLRTAADLLVRKGARA
jgi:acyl carrier protein